MVDDPIVAEVRRVRREHAERFGFDLARICADLREKEKAYADRLVKLPAKKKSTEAIGVRPPE